MKKLKINITKKLVTHSDKAVQYFPRAARQVTKVRTMATSFPTVKPQHKQTECNF